MKLLLDPVPHAEAAALISGKPLVTRTVFDGMREELRARAFTIAGVEDFDILQGVRDQIASLPAGADWNAVKKEIAAKISPWFDPKAAATRAELLMRHHAFSAYAACEARIQNEMADVFPFRQYLSSADFRVRSSHAALHGIILPSGHPFWATHTPPWEFNCRCQVVPLTAEDAGEERSRDAARPPEARRVLEGPALDALAQGRLSRGPSENHQLGPSIQRTADFTIPYEKLAERWDTATREDFEKFADGIPMESGTLLSHLRGEGKATGPRMAAQDRPATFAEALKRAGLADKPVWTRADLANLRASMRVADPAKAADLVKGITGARQTGGLTEKEILRTVQDMLDILPRHIADSLPVIDIGLQDAKLGGGDAVWSIKGKHIRITTAGSLKGLKGEERRRRMRRILSHELMHCLHDMAKGKQADIYRANIAAHYAARTSGNVPVSDGEGGFLRKDPFYAAYCGREYAFENGNPAGLEIPATHFELWDAPEQAIEFSDADKPNSAAFRETFALVHSIFDSAP